jgi:hypothetical protein
VADSVHGASVSASAVRTPEQEAGRPEQEAGRIAEAFDFYDRGGHWEVAGDRLAEDSPYGTARVCRVVPARVLHVIGASAMAEQLRHLYGCGAVTGWALQPMPETRTLLHTVKRAILQAADGLGRGFTQLTRGSFVHTEEVQACPDLAMLGVDNIGPGTVAVIRSVLPYTGPDPAEVAAEQADAGDARVFGGLVSAAAARAISVGCRGSAEAGAWAPAPGGKRSRRPARRSFFLVKRQTLVR